MVNPALFLISSLKKNIREKIFLITDLNTKNAVQALKNGGETLNYLASWRVASNCSKLSSDVK